MVRHLSGCSFAPRPFDSLQPACAGCKRNRAQGCAHKVQTVLTKEQLVTYKKTGGTEHAAFNGLFGFVFEGVLDGFIIGQLQYLLWIEPMFAEHAGHYLGIAQVTALYPERSEQAVDKVGKTLRLVDLHAGDCAHQ